jgi:hypothetical protein
MGLAEDIELSAISETAFFRKEIGALYKRFFYETQSVFEEVRQATKDFCIINPQTVVENPKALRIFRYSVAPSLSQMKFEQEFGITAIGALEVGIVKKATLKSLRDAAPKICSFLISEIDPIRFPWVSQKRPPTTDEIKTAQLWTCGLIADQNSLTAYRNYRKEVQETQICDFLRAAGYNETKTTQIVGADSLAPGHFCRETKVQGETLQKADIVIRSKKTKRLVLIEAKAVGVAIDAYKRVKECCDKSRDWQKNPDLLKPQVTSCIAGFFSPTNIATLQSAGVTIIWEHRLGDLASYV